MNTKFEFLAMLREIAGKSLLQDSPYAVVAPDTVELAAQIVRAARDCQFNIMVLGSGSTFPPDFTILRENLLALMTIRLSGVNPVSPFAARVLAGTPLSAIVQDGSVNSRRTIGGVLCDPKSLASRPVRALWARIHAVEVMGKDGALRRFATSAAAGMDDPGTASLLLGSRGRLGLITAVELDTPLPIVPGESDGEKRVGFDLGEGAAALAMKDVQPLLDPDGLFQWS